MSHNQTIADVLVERLRSFGATRVWGEPLGDLDHIDIEEGDLAVGLADADGRIGAVGGRGRVGVAYLQDQVLHISSQPSGTSTVYSITSIGDLVAALHEPVGLDVPDTIALHLDLDLATPVDIDSSSLWEHEQIPVVTLNESLAELRLIMIVGPGVIRSGAVDHLAHCVRHGGFGVVNTIGAKGVQRWDSPYHLGTVGLNARDLELAGCLDAHVIIASGIDPLELPSGVFSRSVTQEVPSTQLGALTRAWASRPIPATQGKLVEQLNAIVHPLYETAAPGLTAARASLHIAGSLPENGIVVADNGRAGWWIARTLPTGIGGSVIVPALPTEGFAAAAAIVCAIEGRPYVAVTDVDSGDMSSLATMTQRYIDCARRIGAQVQLEAWNPSRTPSGNDGETSRYDQVEVHVESLHEQFEHQRRIVEQHSSDVASNTSHDEANVLTVRTVDIDYQGEDDLFDTLGAPLLWQR